MKVLVIHGAGMNMRGKVQVEVFGPMTLPQYDEQIRKFEAQLMIIAPHTSAAGVRRRVR